MVVYTLSEYVFFLKMAFIIIFYNYIIKNAGL